MDANAPKLIVRGDLQRDIEEPALHGEFRFIEQIGEPRLRLPDHDGIAAQQREMAVTVGGLHPFAVRKVESGILEPLLEGGDVAASPHFTDAENVRPQGREDLRHCGDFLRGFGFRVTRSADRGLTDGVEVIPQIPRGKGHRREIIGSGGSAAKEKEKGARSDADSLEKMGERAQGAHGVRSSCLFPPLPC